MLTDSNPFIPPTYHSFTIPLPSPSSSSSFRSPRSARPARSRSFRSSAPSPLSLSSTTAGDRSRARPDSDPPSPTCASTSPSSPGSPSTPQSLKGPRTWGTLAISFPVMTPPAPRPSSSSLARNISPPKLDQYELLYNSAVQSFVRRDHVKTQATLARLLDLTRALPRTQSPWYDLAAPSAPQPGDEWMTKTLKLAISANASLYSDPPKNAGALSNEVAAMLPPASPRQMLSYILNLCVSTYGTSLLPPQLISTFLLASLKLQPLPESLEFAHQLVEDWLANLPDEFVLGIAAETKSAPSKKKKKLEQAREGYLKVVEIFIGEVLSREGEWEMARGLLEGEMVMGIKKKEALYRHLRNLQAKPVSQAPSPAASGILPSPSPMRSSESEASSEATARPAGHSMTPAAAASDASTIQPTSTDSEHTIPAAPRPAHAQRSSSPARAGGARGESAGWIAAVFSPFLVEKIHAYGGLHVVLGAPVAAIVVALLILKRIRARAGRVGVAVDRNDVREKLRRVRNQGLIPFIQWALRWWAEKLAGVWKLGTTITYM